MRRWLVAISLIAMAGLAAACASTGSQANPESSASQESGTGGSAWWARTGVSMCGFPAMVRVAGRVVGAGNCAGLFLRPAEKVTVHVGEEIDVHMLQQPAGASPTSLVPVFPLPHSSDPAVLSHITSSADRATGTYRAIRAGHAVLISEAACIEDQRQVHGNCPVVQVTVVGR